MFPWMLALAAASPVDQDVAHGWYLYRTGQVEKALEAADDIGLDQAEGEAMPFVIGMSVFRGRGPSLEAELRDRWSEDRDDPGARLALAWVLTLRHSEAGGWCDEVTTLIKPLTTGLDRYWSAKVDMERERRCAGSTEHAEAELRRVAKAGDGPVADAAFGTLRAGYYKVDFPEALESALAEQPHGIEGAGVAFGPRAAGPALGKVRKILNRALDDAMASDDPSLVYAALKAYRSMGKDKPAEEALARLRSLDPEADPDIANTLGNMRDAPQLAEIDTCTATATSLADGVACLRSVELGSAGPMAAYQQHLLRVLLEQQGKADEAYEAARAAFQADSSNRLYAAVFADRALERGEDLPLALQAARAVLDGRMPTTAAEVPPHLAKRRAAALERLATIESLAGEEEQGLTHMNLALALEDTPARRHRLGHALAAAGRIDEAVLTLLRALGSDVDDTSLLADSRRVVSEHLGDWHPDGLKGALAELGGTPPDPHPLVGEDLPEDVLDTEEEDDEAAAVTAIVLWDGQLPASEGVLVRLQGIADRYDEQGVAFHVLDVGLATGVVPEEVTLPVEASDASVLRALHLVSVPSVVVLDDRDEVSAVLAGYDADGLDLEKALDELLPDEG